MYLAIFYLLFFTIPDLSIAVWLMSAGILGGKLATWTCLLAQLEGH
jgi:hypothetical protein